MLIVSLLAVVKANAYGHGDIEVATTALANVWSWLKAVTMPEEGLRLRRAGIAAPILVLGGFNWLTVRNMCRQGFSNYCFSMGYSPSLI